MVWIPGTLAARSLPDDLDVRHDFDVRRILAFDVEACPAVCTTWRISSSGFLLASPTQCFPACFWAFDLPFGVFCCLVVHTDDSRSENEKQRAESKRGIARGSEQKCDWSP